MEEAELKKLLEEMGQRAKKAAQALAALSDAVKRQALEKMAQAIEKAQSEITAANELDLANGRSKGLSNAKLDRLKLTPERISGMAQGLRIVAAQNDPVGRILDRKVRPNGLEITKISVPFGVIGIVYESRPNVTADASGICLKAGNAVILRGGSDAFNSNKLLAKLLNEGAMACGIPDGAVQLIPVPDREAVKLMLKMDKYVDLVIPRGGENLIRLVVNEATMPVLKHYKGVCHVFVEKTADPDAAEKIIINAKCQRPGVCNALETLLIDRAIAGTFAPRIAAALAANGAKIRGDEEIRRLVPGCEAVEEENYYNEYLDKILSAHVVDGVKAAVEHINHYGSHHSDSIISCDEAAIEYFYGNVDSAVVYANASTRFTDGGEFGLGAEIGISTDKLHARGPMGADELTSYKYLVRGSGQIR